MAERKFKILIVDDDRDLVKILCDRLEFDGLDTIEAYEGLRAIEAAHKQKPDLIVLDIQIPTGSGDAVLQALRARHDTAKIPIMIITGSSKYTSLKTGPDEIVQDLLMKPFDLHVFLDRVRALLPAVPFDL